MPVACFSEEGPLSRSSLNGGRRRVSAWANPILSVQVCSLKRSAHENWQEIAGFLHFCRTFSKKIIQNLKYRSFESPRKFGQNKKIG